MQSAQTRRRLLATLSSAAAACLFGGKVSAQEAPPEITTIRLAKNQSLCIGPQYVAEDLLRAEGFTTVRYLMTDGGAGQSKMLAQGEIDFTLHFSPLLLIPIDAGEKITIIAGVHVGCFELFATDRIRTVADLKGKTVGVQNLGNSPYVFVSAMAAYVGLDPSKDINWVTSPTIAPKELFADGKIDAFLGFPPEPQELRARKIGRVVVNSSIDRPWSQYFCCMLGGNRDFVRKNPVATKRVARAILKATDFCVSDRTGAAHDRWRIRQQLRLCATDVERSAVQQVARIRPGRHDPVLFFTVARSRHDQIESQQDHRRGRGLAFLQRAQTRAEELITSSRGRGLVVRVAVPQGPLHMPIRVKVSRSLMGASNHLPGL